MNLKFPFLLLSTFLIFISCSIETENKDNSSTELESLIEKDWAFRLQEFPVMASSSGTSENNDKLSEVSIDAINRRLTFYREVLQESELINADELETQERINLRMLQFILRNDIAEIENEAYLQPLDGEGGFLTNLMYMPGYMAFNTEEDYENYLKRLKAIPAFIEGQKSMLQLGIEKDKTFPRILMGEYEIKLPTAEKITSDNSAFLKPFKNIPTTISTEKAQELKSKARIILEEEVAPSFTGIRSYFLDTYIPSARETLGASELPGGKAYYEQRVNYYSTLDMTPEEIFQIGIKEVERIKSQMVAIIDSLEFDGSFEEFLHFLRTDPQFYAEDERTLLEYASYICKKTDGALPKFFGKLPRLPYGVEPVPDEIAPFYTTGRYVGGSRENNKSGTYWVNTYNLKQRPLYAIPALSLHEAVPGHHLQVSLAQEMENLPEFRKNTYLSAFGEGWALYTEKLGIEMGIYESPYDHFGRLSYEMWRACRLVVDVGMHYKGWSRQEAIDFMASNTALSLHNVKTEIDRYIGWPAQALSYKIGEIKIVELRKRAEEKLGEKFNIRDFHDVVLANGSIPLFILEEVVDDYIKTKE